MAQTDLYPILRAYANKNNSPYINIDAFLEFLEKYAKHKVLQQGEWEKWTADVGIKFWSEMASLAEEGKCVLMADTPEGRIYMPFFYVDTLLAAYQSLDNDDGEPFPDGESLQISIPEDQLRVLGLDSDLGAFFEKNAEKPTLPVIKLVFPENSGSLLILAPMIPRRLMEGALIKARRYLRSHGNKEYVLHKLSPQFAGKEKYLREMLDKLLIRPLDCMINMETYGDFSWIFWPPFCALIKNDIKKRKEVLSGDIAALQASYVIETCSAFYKARAVKHREQEMAFRDLELHMDKPPLYYTMEAITRFTNSKGVSLLGLYSREELEAYITKRASEGKDNLLPEWFILQGKKGEKWYVKKEKYLPLCARLLIDARPLVKGEITGRWVRLIKSFRSERAMESDGDFDRLLAAYTAKIMPVLAAMLEDEKLLWAYEELEKTQRAIPVSSRIFSRQKLIPMSALYVLKRKDLLTDAKILLPFWYSLPILSAIIAFFMKLRKGKKEQEANGDEGIKNEPAEEKDSARDIQNAARKVEAQLVPKGKTLDSYLAELETRWSRLLNKQARADLINDVQSLARDNLRQVVKIHKSKKINQEGLEETAAGIIAHNSALQSLGGQDSLHLYMELYMVKLLITFKL
jgi:hypothetical protein